MDMSEPTTIAPSPPTLPKIPRLLGKSARRRSWNELPVRLWVVLSIVICVITIYLTASRVHQALKDRSLIHNGLDIKAKIISANGSPTPKRWPRNETIPATIRFVMPDGSQQEQTVLLDAKADAFAMVGTELAIKVDPDDPQRWTEQTVPAAWSGELTTPVMLIGLSLIVVATTLLRRQSVLRVWKNEPLVAATVVEIKHTALAPLSRVVKFTLVDSTNRRVWSILLPVRAGIPQPGETIWLISSQKNPARAIAAKLYVDPPAD
jgi:hypothetical protein